MFKTELYEILKETEDEKITKYINLLTKNEQAIFLSIWEKTSKKSTTSSKSIYLLNKLKKIISFSLYKQNIYEIFLGTKKEEIEYALEKITEMEKINFLKEYSFINNDPLENIDKITKMRNKEIIDKLWLIISKRRTELEILNGLNFYNFFKASESVVNQVLALLGTHDYKLLIKKFGLDFKNVKYECIITVGENLEINKRIIPYIIDVLNKLQNGYIIVGITDIFNTPLEKLQTVVKSLPINEQTRLYSYFGNNLTKKVLIESSKKDKIVSKRGMSQILSKTKVKHVKPFFQLFIKYKYIDETEEEFETRIKSIITKEHYEILKRKYGPDLKKETNTGDFKREDSKYIFSIIKPYIEKRLKNMEETRKITIENQISFKVTIEELTNAIISLENKEQETLYTYFDKETHKIKVKMLFPKDKRIIKRLISRLEEIIIKNRKKSKNLNLKILKEEINILSILNEENKERLIKTYKKD